LGDDKGLMPFFTPFKLAVDDWLRMVMGDGDCDEDREEGKEEFSLKCTLFTAIGTGLVEST
jgi:hypothetical protein